MAQWIQYQPVNQSVAGSIPRQGKCLGCGTGPQYGALERQPHIDVSLPPSLPLSLKINKILKNILIKKKKCFNPRTFPKVAVFIFCSCSNNLPQS